MCLAGLCKGAKLKIEAGTDLIYWWCGGVTGSNAIVFTGDGVGYVQTNLSAAKGVVNVKVTKDLLYFVCDDGKRDELPSRLTDLFS